MNASGSTRLYFRNVMNAVLFGCALAVAAHSRAGLLECSAAVLDPVMYVSYKGCRAVLPALVSKLASRT